MTLTAWAIDEVPADGQIMRQAMGSLVGKAGGIEATGALKLTQKGTPNMSVQIAAGGVWVPGSVTTTQGPYYVYNSATFEQPIVAAGASNPRVDTIVMRILDEEYEGASKEPKFESLKGTEEPGVTLPNKNGKATVPKSCYVLGYVLVPPVATTIVTADIESTGSPVGLGMNLRSTRIVTGATTAKAGERLICTGGPYTITLPATPLMGQEVEIWSLGTEITVTGGSVKISGDFKVEATSVVLEDYQHLTLTTEGARWLIVAGEPRRDETWGAVTARTSGTSYEPSATRPSFVVVGFEVLGGGAEAMKVGRATVTCSGRNFGMSAMSNGVSTIFTSFMFYCPPGVTWSTVLELNAINLTSSYMIL
jgi:hypothetical protein